MDNRGFTIVEVLIASVVLLVMLVFSAPKLAYRPFTDRKSRDIEAAARYFHED